MAADSQPTTVEQAHDWGFPGTLWPRFCLRCHRREDKRSDDQSAPCPGQPSPITEVRYRAPITFESVLTSASPGPTLASSGTPIGGGDGYTFIPRNVYHHELAALLAEVADLRGRVQELEAKNG